MDSISDYDLGWLVGILEGEGCFGIIHGSEVKNGVRHRHWTVHISLNMTDYDIVKKAHTLLRATQPIRTQPGQKEGWKTQYDFRIISNLATYWMIKLRPFMGTRRQDKIDEVLKEKEESRQQMGYEGAEQIRNLRDTTTMNQRQIAEYVGVSQACVSMVLSGKRWPIKN